VEWDPSFAKIAIALTPSISIYGTDLVTITWFVTVIWYINAGVTEVRALTYYYALFCVDTRRGLVVVTGVVG